MKENHMQIKEESFMEWLSILNEVMSYSQCTKALIERRLRFHSECQNQRCDVFCDPDDQKQHLQKDIKEIKIEARSGAIKDYNNFIVAHSMNEEKDTIKNVVRWLKVQEFLKRPPEKVGKRMLEFFCQ